MVEWYLWRRHWYLWLNLKLTLIHFGRHMQGGMFRALRFLHSTLDFMLIKLEPTCFFIIIKSLCKSVWSWSQRFSYDASIIPASCLSKFRYLHFGRRKSRQIGQLQFNLLFKLHISLGLLNMNIWAVSILNWSVLYEMDNFWLRILSNIWALYSIMLGFLGLYHWILLNFWNIDTMHSRD